MKSFIYIFLVVLFGCSAAGVPFTSDPSKKLEYCYALLNQSRPLPAEKLAYEALNSYSASGDKYGMAEAHTFLGQLYKHPSYRQFSSAFSDYDPTNGKSIKHGQMAVSLFSDIGNYTQVAKAQFGLANAYLDENRAQACSLYSQSKSSFAKGQLSNPNESFQINPNFKSFDDMVDAFSKKYCADA